MGKTLAFFRRVWGRVLFAMLITTAAADTKSEELIVQLGNSDEVTLVGVFNRWDADGNPRRPVNPKAVIARPEVNHVGKRRDGGHWSFDVPPGRYDLVIVAPQRRVRIEGFHYPPVLEFDPVMLHSGSVPAATRRPIAGDIARSRHYENKVNPLYFAGQDKQVRVLMQLLRDEPTSFDSQFGEQAATLRHEVWQYTERYGAWSKEKRTRVLDRVLMAKRQLRQWTWIWEPKLGAVTVGDSPAVVKYELPKAFDPQLHRGLAPY